MERQPSQVISKMQSAATIKSSQIANPTHSTEGTREDYRMAAPESNSKRLASVRSPTEKMLEKKLSIESINAEKK